MTTMVTETSELKRRTVLKTLIWRLIGVVWTWVGAYFIILFIPERWNNAAIIATLIVIYHHSTRMIMYYFYERIWSRIGWGKYDAKQEDDQQLSWQNQVLWVLGSGLTILLIFVLIVYVAR